MQFDNRLTYTVDEAAGLLGISRATIYRLAVRNELTMIKILGRTVIEGAELVAMVERMKAASLARVEGNRPRGPRGRPPAVPPTPST